MWRKYFCLGRRCVTGTVLLAAFAIPIALLYIHAHLDSELRRRIEAKLQAGWPHLQVSVGKAHIAAGEGIHLEDISVVARKAGGPRAELLSIDRIRVLGPSQLHELFAATPRVDRLIVEGLVARATRRANGEWSLAQLWPLPKLGKVPVPGEIRGGVLEIFDPSKSPTSMLVLEPLHFALAWKAEGRDTHGEPAYVGHWTGDFAAKGLESTRLQGTFNPATHDFELRGKAGRLELGPELWRALPSECDAWTAHANTLRGILQVEDFQVRYSPSSREAWSFAGKARLSQGSLHDSRLPYPLADITGPIHWDHTGVNVGPLRGRSGPSTWSLSCSRRGYTAGDPWNVIADVRRLRLEERVFQLLSPRVEKLRTVWDHFQPRGEIDLHFRTDAWGNWSRAQAEITCHGVSVNYHKFPYRVDGMRGKLKLHDGVLNIELDSRQDSQAITVRGDIVNPGDQHFGTVDVRGSGIPVNESLWQAVPLPARKVLRDMRPRGQFDFEFHSERSPRTNWHPEKSMDVRFEDATIEYARFPYPLSDVRGVASMRNDTWTFGTPEQPLTATGGNGLVTCHGSLRPWGPRPTGLMARPPKRLSLHFTGQDIPLDGQLLQALPADAQHGWRQLRPRGMIDFATDIEFLSSTKSIDVRTVVNAGAGTVSLEPVFFPYRMDKVAGQIRIDKNRISWDRLQAEHGATEVITAGEARCDSPSDWEVRLRDFHLAWRAADRDLPHALPPALRQMLLMVQPMGVVTVDGNLLWRQVPAPAVPLHTEWNLKVDAANVALDAGLPLRNIQGGFSRLTGQADGEQFFARGELAVDSLTLWGHQFTDVSGPCVSNLGGITFGQAAVRGPQPIPARPVSAKFYDGTLSGHGHLSRDAVPRYVADLHLHDADLARVAREALPGTQQLAGKLFGQAQLRGAGRDLRALQGGGELHLREADIYQLPVMVALLKILNLRLPDTKAFTDSDLEFRVANGLVELPSIGFYGDAVSLDGSGYMDFQTQMDLSFSATVGRAGQAAPLLRQLVRQAGQRIMPVRVRGTLRDPQMWIEPFPAFNEAMESMQEGLLGEPPRPTQPRLGTRLLWPLR